MGHHHHKEYSKHSPSLRRGRGEETSVVYDYKYHKYSRHDDDGGSTNTSGLQDLYSENNTFSTSIEIRVTPHDDFLFSWAILWGLFVCASMYAGYQVYLEHKVLAATRQIEELEQAAGTASDGEGISTADETRALFRRLLLLAMLTRVVVIPIQIWSDPVWCQFFADTLPEMVFASAWTTLVSFIVQLVGLAKGLGTNTSPSIVIQATAYVVYGILLITQIWNAVATVLLYALMCCIYAALLGTGAYFCTVLLSLLKPSLERHRGLTIRLSICSFLIMSVFLAHTIGYARLVVAPPQHVYWWWQYGVLELIPSSIFLFIMNPSSNKSQRNQDEGATTPPLVESSSSGLQPVGTLKRSDSTGSAASGALSTAKVHGGVRGAVPPQEATLLPSRSSASYGSTSNATISFSPVVHDIDSSAA